MLKSQKPLDTGWDYRSASNNQLTHGIHPYPAMMIYQVARRLIREYGTPGNLLFDPYCGTATALLEAMLAGLVSVGTDLNPLARLIARVKTTPINVDDLDREIEDFIAFGIDATYTVGARPETPRFPNIDYWFDQSVQRDLVLVLDYVARIRDPKLADFFRVAFSLTVRKCSWTRNSEFKLVRLSQHQMDGLKPDVFSTMIGILNTNRDAMRGLIESLPSDLPRRTIRSFDTVEGISRGVLRADSVDLVVTSPPYGDSKTTVAYGQFSRLSSQWLGYADASRIDNVLLGGTKRHITKRFGIDVLDETISSISRCDAKRGAEVASFFADYRRSIGNVASVIKPGGFACYVVGNRTVRGLTVPTAETTAALFEASGFDHVATFSRNIPNKRMPHLNSPSNIAGQRGKTMSREFIVVCQKR